MTYSAPARSFAAQRGHLAPGIGQPSSSARRPSTGARHLSAGVLLAGLLIGVAAYGYPLLASSTAASPIAVLRAEQRGPLGEADGVVPDGTTVFDNQIPGVANLDPALLGALRRAATDAAHQGVEFFVNSGWRSQEYEQQLLVEAVAQYGSEEAAARWVATPATSPHVSGKAVDLGPVDATTWLSKHGATYGLCQIYRNEPWHYELRPEARARGCPPMYVDPTHDPRMKEAK